MENFIKFLFVILLMINYVSSSDENYCTNHNNAPTHNLQELHFTKETVDHDYTIKGDRNKWLHCCARGYRTIEW